MNGTRLMPDRGGALRKVEKPEDIQVPIYGDRIMLMTPEAARALRDWLVANVVDDAFGGSE